MLFSFELLLLVCVYETNFTNRLEQTRVRSILAKLLKMLANYSTYTLEQIKQEDEHFRFINNKKERELIIKEVLKHH